MADEQAQVTLYWLEKSRAQRIVWLLEELRIPYDVEVFRRNSSFLAPPELEKVHPLGKSPVVSVTPPGGEKIILAESGFITSYLCDHLPEGKRLVPKKWKDGKEGQFGGETEEWMRYEYLMHYSEGSLMPPLVMTLVFMKMKAGAPFFVRPIVNMIADKVLSMFVVPNLKKHLTFLEQQLSTSSGDYLCGKDLTAADINVSYGVLAFETRLDSVAAWDGGWQAEHPNLAAYIQKLKAEPGYVKSNEKVKEFETASTSKL